MNENQPIVQALSQAYAASLCPRGQEILAIVLGNLAVANQEIGRLLPDSACAEAHERWCEMASVAALVTMSVADPRSHVDQQLWSLAKATRDFLSLLA